MVETTRGFRVLARTHRPRRFDEVVGQEPVARTIVGAIEAGRVAHAYLFCGSRGVGKTSIARILARALNCETGPTATPCDTCERCRAILAGTDVDFVEIDGASNRGIDEIRNIRDNVRYRPSNARYKIYLIDEVHMLTPQAFNALLKTLEEPPDHVKFFFATTQPYDLPDTIRSRCQRLDFRRIPPDLGAAHLARVCAAEGIEAEPRALAQLARSARGAMRDALVRLDQVRAFTGGAVTAADVDQVLGSMPLEEMRAWAASLADRDVAGLFERVAGLYEAGGDLEAFLDQWVEFLRDLLVVKACGARSELLVLALGDEQLETLAARFETVELTALVGLFIETGRQLRKASLPRVLVETAFVRAALWDDWLSPEALASALEGRTPDGPGRRPEPAAAPPAGAAQRPPASPVATSLDAGGSRLQTGGAGLGQAEPLDGARGGAPADGRYGAPPRDVPPPSEPPPPAAQAPPPAPSESRYGPPPAPAAEGVAPASEPAAQAPSAEGALDAARLQDVWRAVVARIAESEPLLLPVLKKGQPAAEGQRMRIAFSDPDVAFAIGRIKQDPAQLGALEDAVRAELGPSWRIELRLTEAGSQPARTQADVASDPLVKAVLDIFGGRIIEVRPGGPRPGPGGNG